MREEESGRHFVLLSLAEAETIRCILHMRQGQPLIAGADAAVALRCIPAHDALFDASDAHPASPAYMRSVRRSGAKATGEQHFPWSATHAVGARIGTGRAQLVPLRRLRHALQACGAQHAAPLDPRAAHRAPPLL